MRWFTRLTLAVTLLTAASAVCSQTADWRHSIRDVSSAHIEYFLDKAETALAEGRAAANESKFILARLKLKDAEFFLKTALEFALPETHPTEAYFRDEIARLHNQIDNWGGGETPQQAAGQWWERIYRDQAEAKAYWIVTHQNDTYSARMAYYISRYWPNVLMAEMQEFRAKYPTAEALVTLLPAAAETRRHWDGSPAELSLYDWSVGVVEAADLLLTERLQATMPDVLTETRRIAMELEDKDIASMIPGQVEIALKEALTVIDNARVVLGFDRDSTDAEKLRSTGEQILAKLREKSEEWEFHIEDVRMPEDVNPGDTALHQELQAAYEAWAQANGYDEQLLRVVLTGDWVESTEAWWVGNLLHWGTFRRIPGALAIRQGDDFGVFYCTFYRKLQADGQWSPTKLELVRTSEPILEQNIAL